MWPTSQAPLLLFLLDTLQGTGALSVVVVLNPRTQVDELPLQRYYRSSLGSSTASGTPQYFDTSKISMFFVLSIK